MVVFRYCNALKLFLLLLISTTDVTQQFTSLKTQWLVSRGWHNLRFRRAVGLPKCQQEQVCWTTLLQNIKSDT